MFPNWDFRKVLLCASASLDRTLLHQGRTPISRTYLQMMCWLPWFAIAVVTKFHGLGGLKNRSLFSHHSGGSKSQLRAGLAASWLRGGRFLAVSSVHVPLVCLSKFLPFIIPVKLTRAHSNAPFYLNTSLKALSPNTFIFGGAGNWGFNIGVVGDTIQPTTEALFFVASKSGNVF